jgi:hypothetical protein
MGHRFPPPPPPPPKVRVSLDLLQIFNDFFSKLLEYEHYTWQCRCSGSYEITDENLSNGENVICCTTCSLTIRVLYCPKEQVNNK